MMQRQRRKHEPVEASPFPTKSSSNELLSGSHRAGSIAGAPVARTNSKMKQSRQRGVYLMVVGIPVLVILFVAYCTLQLHPGGNLEWVATHGEYRDALAKIPPVRDLRDDSVGKTSDGFEYHIVFSTGCSLYQDWQSYVFFYQAMVSKQPGTITRIVSGCKDAHEEEEMRKIFNEQIHPMAPGRFKLHITPDFSKLPNGKSFVYFNKPFGMKHWMENALGFPKTPENENAIVILVDPDQLILRPFHSNDFSNTDWAFIKKGAKPYTSIEHGKPMGQLYGFGLQWKDKVNITAIVPNSPVDKLTRKEAQAGFIVGPPYGRFQNYATSRSFSSHAMYIFCFFCHQLPLRVICIQLFRHGQHLLGQSTNSILICLRKCLRTASRQRTANYPTRRLGPSWCRMRLQGKWKVGDTLTTSHATKSAEATPKNKYPMFCISVRDMAWASTFLENESSPKTFSRANLLYCANHRTTYWSNTSMPFSPAKTKRRGRAKWPNATPLSFAGCCPSSMQRPPTSSNIIVRGMPIPITKSHSSFLTVLKLRPKNWRSSSRRWPSRPARDHSVLGTKIGRDAQSSSPDV